MPSSETDTSLLGALATGASHRPLDGDAWSAAAESAVVERIAPIVYWRQKQDPSLPRVAADRLRAELYRTAAVNAILFRELAVLLRAAETRKLTPPVLLKGAALAGTLYDDIALRPMGDLDLLVPRAETDAYVALARELGYEKCHPEMAPGLDATVRYHIAMELRGNETAKLELHWQIVAGDSDSRAPEIDWFLEQAETWEPPAGFALPFARSLAPTALLLHLAAHAVLQHGLSAAPMVWLHDIHLVVLRRGSDIDWDRLVDRARQFGWHGAVSLALHEARAMFDTPVPARVYEALEPKEAFAPSAAPSRAEWVWRELGYVRFPERVRLVLAILFPRPAYLRWRYPRAGWLWPTCYPYRWYVVASEGARAVARRALAPRREVDRVDKHG